MGFFDKFKKAAKPAKPAKPEAIVVSEEPGFVYAPVEGEEIELSAVSDPVFGSGAMGKGAGFKPTGETVYAPVGGTLVACGAPNFHALAIAGDNGAEILIHVGVDTVEMKGDGFTVYAEKGAHVAAGTPLLGFSKKKIAAAGHDDVVIMALTNTDDLASVETVASGAVKPGDKAVKFAQ